MSGKKKLRKSKGASQPGSLLALGVTLDFGGGFDRSLEDRHSHGCSESDSQKRMSCDCRPDAGLDALKIKPPAYPSLF